MSQWLVRHAQALVEAGACYGVMDPAADLADTLRAATALAATVPKGAFPVAVFAFGECPVLAGA